MAYKEVRRIPFKGATATIETGAIGFNEDWNGLYIRGDDCIEFKFILEKVLEDSARRFLLSPADGAFLRGLLKSIEDEVLPKPKPILKAKR
jgi:hypothetical protein